MEQLIIDPNVWEAIHNFQLPKVQGFGNVLAPIMMKGDFLNGKWHDLHLLPYGPILLDPCSKVLHYGQEIFEGMKAFKVDSDYPLLFRPDQSLYRLNVAAQRLGMPLIPEEYFFKAIETMVSYSAPYIPEESGQFLYIRPFMFATEPHLSIQNSKTFSFMVVASPAESYFSGSIDVLIERKLIRSVPGGTGHLKAGGNYAASFSSTSKASELGYQQVLWLDPLHKKFVEELSGMNFFAVINGTLCTPQLSDTFLPGITRDSILHLAGLLKIPFLEEKIGVNHLIDQIKTGECSEVFACGTASIICPIKCLGEEDGQKYHLPEELGPITRKIKQTLLDIQEGRKKGQEGWVIPVASLDLQ